MDCWHCERPAHAVCAFCGRAVCKSHAQELPNVLAVVTGKGGKQQVLAVPNAVWCGVCKPREEPVDLDEVMGK